MVPLKDRKKRLLLDFDELDRAYPIPRQQESDWPTACGRWEEIYAELRELDPARFSFKFVVYLMSVGSAYYSYLPNFKRAADILLALEADPRYRNETRSFRAVSKCWIGLYLLRAGKTDSAADAWRQCRNIFGKFGTSERILIGGAVIDQFHAYGELTDPIRQVTIQVLVDARVRESTTAQANDQDLVKVLAKRIGILRDYPEWPRDHPNVK